MYICNRTTNNNGRKLKVSNVLLWQAILDSKKLGCHWFDIGGLTEGTPLGVAKFKKGLNSKYYTLLGEWLFFPKLRLFTS